MHLLGLGTTQALLCAWYVFAGCDGASFEKLEHLQCSLKLRYGLSNACVWGRAACAARPRTVGEPLSDAEAYAMAADASMDLEGMAVGSGVWADVASGKNCSLYCNGKKVTPEEDAVQLGSNKTQVLLCVICNVLRAPALYTRFAVVRGAWLGLELGLPARHMQAFFYCAQARRHRSPVERSIQPVLKE